MKWVLDAGHGGKDPGAVGPSGLKEADVALKIVLKVRDILKKNGESVLLTRDLDRFIELSERSRISNNYQADYFVSFHLNATTSSETSGTETLVYSNKSASYNLAKRINDNLVRVLGTKDRSIKERPGLYVLKHTVAPSLLIEIDFISNPAVEQKMRDEEYVDLVAKSIADPMLEYVGKHQNDDTNDYDSEFINALKELSDKGIINSYDYWKDNDVYKTEYVRELIIKFARYI